MNQTPTTRFVFRATTTCGRPTTRMLESSVAMKMPTVVTVRTTHLYSKNEPPRLLACPGLGLDRYKMPPMQEPKIPIVKRYSESFVHAPTRQPGIHKAQTPSTQNHNLAHVLCL